ncbi:MAG: glutamate--cysteine ligase [Alphaproteobacteria bacterium]|nr:MAG: glutamate--cysteine ligase [Alphaproteobacteria bacterium]
MAGGMVLVLPLLNRLCADYPLEIQQWFQQNYHARPAPLYSSVDLRHSGFKIAPVDTNLFPAGFNNISDAAFHRGIEAMGRLMRRDYPDAKRVMFVMEQHTRNLPYFDNVARLCAMIEGAGYEVVVVRLDLPSDEQTQMVRANGDIIDVQGVLLNEVGHIASAAGFVPDIVILNNDLSTGCPQLLIDAQQPIIPSLEMGWYRRRKSTHFAAYHQVVQEFARHFELDPWIMSTATHQCGQINFKERQGLECVALGVEKVLHQIAQKYAEYGIIQEPYVYIKADNGTYGMGIMTVKDSQEVFDINKKNRNKMNVIKEGVQTTEVLIQEGIPTIDRHHGHSAEPMVYLMDGVPLGYIWRSNAVRDDRQSLNSMGMQFDAYSEEQMRAYPAYGVLAQLATLATCFEYSEDMIS